MNKLLFLDTETTSYEPELCGMWQVSGIIDFNGKIVEEFKILSNIFPNDLVREEAFEKNKCSLEEIHKMPKPLVAFSQFTKILKKYVDQYDKLDKFTVLGYNCLTFDNPVLRKWFLQNGNKFFGSWFWHPWIDVMNLAAYVLMNERYKLENLQLGTVAEYLGINIDKDNCHDGLYDSKITRLMYYELTK